MLFLCFDDDFYYFYVVFDFDLVLGYGCGFGLGSYFLGFIGTFSSYFFTISPALSCDNPINSPNLLIFDIYSPVY